MTDVTEIISGLEAPLSFMAGDSFAALHMVRSIGKTLSSPVERALEIRPKSPALLEMLKLADGIDTQPLEEKKSRLARFLELFRAVMDGTAPMAPPRPPDPPPGAARRLDPSTPVKYVKGVGPVLAERFAARSIATVSDLLGFFPSSYEDRRNLCRIGEAAAGSTATIMGTIAARGMGGRRVFEMVVTDGSGRLSLTWFHMSKPFVERLTKEFGVGDAVVASGKVSVYQGRPQIAHPELRKAEAFEEDDLNYRRIVPRYPKIEGIGEGHLLRILSRAVEGAAQSITDPLPRSLLDSRSLLPLPIAIRDVHFPPDGSDMDMLSTTRSPARRRLAYDEFFFIELMLAKRRSAEALKPGISFRPGRDPVDMLSEVVPFTLTGAQKRVLGEIGRDMERPSPMNRLLQGDVGSGKTAVAFGAMLVASACGYQSAMIAPTEILALQHLRNLRNYAGMVRDKGISVGLLTGAVKGAGRREVLDGLRSGAMDIAVGTHALLEEGVVFRKLGLAIIDEQHRFGVLQRAEARAKGENPDILVMTATPIPRTLAMTLFGDLDLSVIDEIPPGRSPVHTKVFSHAAVSRCHEIMEREIAKGRQCYVVYPLVEESESVDLRDATNMAVEFRTAIFPGRRVGLLHGRMKDREKDEVMGEFKGGRLDILVSTTVIEVGVDVPNASVMVVEHAERFGLSQLHQLRGRVGRGAAQSYCLLVAGYGSEDARKRLRVMEKTTDGFIIAEEDLAIRGPGELAGTRQSGLPDLAMGSLSLDAGLIAAAKEDAFAIIEKDPELDLAENASLKTALARRAAGRVDLSKVG